MPIRSKPVKRKRKTLQKRAEDYVRKEGYSTSIWTAYVRMFIAGYRAGQREERKKAK